MMVTNPKELIGRELSGYRLESILGAGATGAVFFGRKADPSMPPAAIKVFILPWQASEADRAAFQERFRREAQALLALNNKYIPKILGFGIEADFDYLVLQFIDNGSLFQRLQAGPMAYDEILRYTQQLSEALDYAHQQNLIHRDIKPANVLLDRQGNAYLADFSIARLFNEGNQKNLTATGQTIGTPEYMSPEQMRGTDLAPSSDIYSLGLLVYQMVTGRVPFQGNSSYDLAIKHNQEPPPSPRAIRPDLPPPAEAAILRALSKQPEQRFRTARDFFIAFAEGTQNRYTATNPMPTNYATGMQPPVPGPMPLQTNMASNTSGQYIPPTGPVPTPMPVGQQGPVSQGQYAQGPISNVPTYTPPVQQGPSSTQQGSFTYTPPAQPQGPQTATGKRSSTPLIVGGIIAFVVVACLVVSIIGQGLSRNNSSGSSNVGAGSQATATATTATTAATATTIPTATIAATSTTASPTKVYSAIQPGPGCDKSGGTWSSAGFGEIDCVSNGTNLVTKDGSAIRGYLYLTLPNSVPIATPNRIGMTANVGSSYVAICAGLAELGNESGYLAEFCENGHWYIYSIATTGAIIQTLNQGLSSARTTVELGLTISGNSLGFTFDTEKATYTIQAFQPKTVGLSFNYGGSSCCRGSIVVSNFSYVDQS